ncbi:MAG: hypothetical protein PHY79_18655 [Anaerolineae bacterium]|nr:hypothetical protein [Anaerolineae bacterium]
MRRALIRLVGLLLLLPLAGCSFSGGKLLDAEQPLWEQGSELSLAPGRPVGQSFVAQHGGLAGVELLLAADPGTEPTLTLHLRSDPQSATDLATASLQVPGGQPPSFYRFSFPVQGNSHGRYYYAFLEADEAGARVATGGGEAYLNGAAYAGHEPQDRQLAFGLAYDPGRTLLDLLGAGIAGLGLLLAAGLLFVVPGWALLNCLMRERDLNWPVRLGLAAGISLALYPVLLLWTDLVGLHLGPLYAWLPAGLGVAALAWQNRSWRPQQAWTGFRLWLHSEAAWPDLALLLVLVLVVAVRLLIVRSLDVPLWGDSYQHTMIVQLLVDNRGLFDSWAPYVDLDQFTYHFGFHSTAAALHWLSGLPAQAATLWAGQLINVLSVVALYPLAHRIAAGLSNTGRRWAGLGAVLFAGLLCQMPMVYSNWGRYTQLAGQVILPAAAWLTWETLDEPRLAGRRAALIALAVGGLALTHYRVLLFYGCFVFGLLLVALRERSGRRLVRRLAGAGAGTLLLFLPWFWATYGTVVQQMFVIRITTPPDQVHAFVQEYNQIGDLRTFLAPLGWLTLLIGLGLGMWERRRGMLLLAIWWLLSLIVANPEFFSLPGTGIISNFALFIAAYLPAAVAGGYLAARLADVAGHRSWMPALVALLALGLALYGATERLSDLDPRTHALVTRPDVRAAAWIRANTPPESRFLVNSFFAYGGTSPVGSDGGWWLPLLAGRQVTVPPLAYGGEVPLEAGARLRIQELNARVHDSALDDPALLALLRAEGVTHVYVGQRQGRVNSSGENAINPHLLAESASYRLVYQQDRVWIFQVLGVPPGQGSAVGRERF